MIPTPGPVNIYFLQNRDGTGYRRVSKSRVNAMIESGRAEWVGTDWNEETQSYAHFADRIR